MALARSYAKFISSLNYNDLPIQVADKLKASILHALVVSIIGAQTHHGKSAIELTKEEESKSDGATILVDGAKATRAGAAFANSKLMHATNQTDSYRMLIHPGPCIIPAALATAELTGASGQDFITALSAGYEVESRIAGDFIPTTQARGFRCSPIYGTLGAAITTGKLLGLDEDQLVTALALACTFAAGTTEGPRVSSREMMYHEPQATRAGITAALLARENLHGSETCLEGEAGFYNAFTGNNRGELSYTFTPGDGEISGTTDIGQTVQDLGSRWELLHITPKIYPTAGYNCPVIDLTTRACANNPIPLDEVESINMEMNWLETSYPSPAFPNQDRSMPGVGSTHYFIAYTWVHGHYPPLRSQLDTDEDNTATDRAISDLQRRVTVTGHRNRANFSPRITIYTKSGEEYHDEFTGNELKLDLATETSVVTALFSQIPWPRTKLDQIVSTVTTLDEETDIAGLIQSCVPGQA